MSQCKKFYLNQLDPRETEALTDAISGEINVVFKLESEQAQEAVRKMILETIKHEMMK